MAEVILFHHAQGLTDGVRAFAAELRGRTPCTRLACTKASGSPVSMTASRTCRASGTRCIPITGEWAFGPWPDGVPVQIHGADKAPFLGLEGDIDAARELVEIVGPDLAELFVYPGDQHLFTDSALPLSIRPCHGVCWAPRKRPVRLPALA